MEIFFLTVNAKSWFGIWESELARNEKGRRRQTTISWRVERGYLITKEEEEDETNLKHHFFIFFSSSHRWLISDFLHASDDWCFPLLFLSSSLNNQDDDGKLEIYEMKFYWIDQLYQLKLRYFESHVLRFDAHCSQVVFQVSIFNSIKFHSSFSWASTQSTLKIFLSLLSSYYCFDKSVFFYDMKIKQKRFFGCSTLDIAFGLVFGLALSSQWERQQTKTKVCSRRGFVCWRSHLFELLIPNRLPFFIG